VGKELLELPSTFYVDIRSMLTRAGSVFDIGVRYAQCGTTAASIIHEQAFASNNASHEDPSPQTRQSRMLA